MGQTAESNCHTRHGDSSQTAPKGHIYLDTETLGFDGIPFLIQYRRADEDEVQIMHVFRHPPPAVAKLLESWVTGACTLVGHNLMFDLFMLSKLATVASMVSDWSFDSIWEAERLWRGEVPYVDRLGHLRLLYPAAVEDTLIAAQSLSPLAEMFMRPTSMWFKRLPVPVVPDLEKIIVQALNRKPFYGKDVTAAIKVGDWVKTTVDGATNRKGRQKIAAQQAREDYSAQREVRVSVKPSKAYSLKSIARLLGYSGTIRKYDFMDKLGRIDPQPSPTYHDRDLYLSLYQFALKMQDDAEFIDYAKRDIDMLAHVHQHFAADPQYATLEHDFQVLPLMANHRLYGVYVDPNQVAETRQLYQQRIVESKAFLIPQGLENYNSPKQVIRFVNRLVKWDLSEGDLDELGVVDNMREETLDRVLGATSKHLGASHSATQALQHLVRVRKSHKRSQFFEAVVGDTLYPSFHIKGTQTDRMTSTKPAIQTMPKKGEDDHDAAADFRSAFIPPPGYQLMVGDFDQFEMRLMAADSKEEHLLSAYWGDQDIHSVTALRTMEAQVRKASPKYLNMSEEQLIKALTAKEEPIKKFRDQGKVLNFAIAYGVTKWGIARLVNMNAEDAEVLIESFNKAYPSLTSSIQATHDSVALIDEQTGMNGLVWSTLGRATQSHVENKVGLRRHFSLAQRFIEVLMKIAETNDMSRYLPVLSGPCCGKVTYYDSPKTPKQIVCSQLRSAARKLQGYVQRQAYNFRIQSLGAVYTKKLQVALAEVGISPGLHNASDLRVLPGINVHDEIHLYTKGLDSQLTEQANVFTASLTKELGVPIKFDLAEVPSWAEKQ